MTQYGTVVRIHEEPDGKWRLVVRLTGRDVEDTTLLANDPGFRVGDLVSRETALGRKRSRRKLV